MDYKTLRETDETVVILPGARVNGDVTFGRGCSVWFNAVIRGDQAPITIGENTNIQDNSTLHTSDRRSMSLGSGVSVGHNVVLHSCTVGDNCLIGMGAIVLNGAKIGNHCLVGAGALVTGKMDAPDGSLILGSPAKVIRPLTEAELADNQHSVDFYANNVKNYR